MDKKTQKKNFIELANIIRECGIIYSKLLSNVKEEDIQRIIDLEAVSYTHLTLPTICSV